MPNHTVIDLTQDEDTDENNTLSSADTLDGIFSVCTCSITFAVPSEPVTTRCGHLFEKRALTSWIAKCRERQVRPHCPVCRSVFRRGRPPFTQNNVLKKICSFLDMAVR